MSLWNNEYIFTAFVDRFKSACLYNNSSRFVIFSDRRRRRLVMRVGTSSLYSECVYRPPTLKHKYPANALNSPTNVLITWQVDDNYVNAFLMLWKPISWFWNHSSVQYCRWFSGRRTDWCIESDLIYAIHISDAFIVFKSTFCNIKPSHACCFTHGSEAMLPTFEYERILKCCNLELSIYQL